MSTQAIKFMAKVRVDSIIPKRRRKIIYGKLRKELRTILQRLCKYKGVEIIEGNLCIDHVHMCLAIPPKYAVSMVVGYLKGKSAMKQGRARLIS